LLHAVRIPTRSSGGRTGRFTGMMMRKVIQLVP
jgi:hypothetical protein